MVLNETHIFSGATLNEFRFSMNRGVPSNGTRPLIPLDSSLAFIPGAGIGNISFTTASGAAVTSVTEWGTSSSSPQTFAQNNFQVGETFSTVRGAHSWKFGFSMERLQLNVLQASNVRGNFSFNSLTTFLQGQPTQFQFQLIDSTHSLVRGYRQLVPGWFAQAAHEVTPEREAWYLVKQRCYLCHFIDAQDERWGRKWGPSLKGLFQRPDAKLINGKPVNDRTVSEWINEGSANMPAFRHTLTPEQIQLIVKFLKQGSAANVPMLRNSR